MSHSLNRILRLRSLLEEVSRMELEMRLQEATRLERGLECIQQSRTSMRQDLHEHIAHGRQDWHEAHVLEEWLAEEQLSLRSMQERKQAEAEIVKAVYLERRKEHRQIKSVVEFSEMAASIKRNRREQQELDDWFGQRALKNRLA